jgi:AcrR family transcriptional regulator
MAAARSYAGRSAQQRRAERRARLLDAGLRLFGTDGYRSTSIEMLCAAAQVSTRAFYEEFSGREELLLALHDQVISEGFTAVLAAADKFSEAPTQERIAAAVQAYVDIATAEPRSTRIGFVEVQGVSAAVEQHRLEWRSRMVEFLVGMAATAVERGEAVDRDYSLTAIAFIGAFNELTAEWVQRGRDVPPEQLSAEVVRLAQAVLTAP